MSEGAGAGAGAEVGEGTGAPVLPGNAILVGHLLEVKVEFALTDFLVVSCGADGKNFHGVLLDCSKKNLPFGVPFLHPIFNLTQKIINGNDNKLYSVSQRFAYLDSDYKPGLPAKPKQQQQRTKMTVRLRPRKVLCSKCKGICNENSENVVQTRKRKNTEHISATKERKSYISDDSNGRNSVKSDNRTLIMGNTLIPKISRLHPNEITNALNGNVYRRNEIWIRQTDDKSENSSNVEKFSGKYKHSEGSGDSNEECPEVFSKGDVAYSSSEKSSDNKFVDDREFDSECERRRRKEELHVRSESDGSSVQKKKRLENSSNNTDESSNSLFSNARTLKISYGEGEGTVVKLPVMIPEFNSGEEEADQPLAKSDSKAARRAIKKAKKHARRQISPETHPSSPICDPPYDMIQKKHRHKVKHKKKKKDDKKIKTVNEDLSESETPDENHSSLDDLSSKDKLSISMDSMHEDSLDKDEAPSDEQMEPENSSSDWVNCEGGFAGIVAGDVVWGKIQGFPWWPGRVVAMGREGQARISWFASTTSSLVPRHRLAPFLDNFKVHFNKKKRGPYKEAVRLATLEAGGPMDPLATDPLAPAPTNTLTPLSSPPIDLTMTETSEEIDQLSTFDASLQRLLKTEPEEGS